MITRPGAKPPSYATAPKPPSYATAPKPPSYATAPRQPSYATAPRQSSYATAPRQRSYVTATKPPNYATARRNLATPLLPNHLATPLLPDNLATSLLPNNPDTPLLPNHLATPLLPNHLVTPHLPDASLWHCWTLDALLIVWQTITALCAYKGDDESRCDGEHTADEQWAAGHRLPPHAVLQQQNDQRGGELGQRGHAKHHEGAEAQPVHVAGDGVETERQYHPAINRARRTATSWCVDGGRAGSSARKQTCSRKNHCGNCELLQWRYREFGSSGTRHHVAAAAKPDTLIFQVTLEDEWGVFLRKVGNYLPIDTASYARRPESTYIYTYLWLWL